MEAAEAVDYFTLFQSRRDNCRTLFELSRRQRELIDEDDYAQLLTLLGRKQRVLGRLDELNRQHPELWKQWRLERERLDPDLRDDCEHVLAETEAILGELLAEETAATDHLTARRNATREQLQTIAQGAEVHDAYRDQLAPVTHRHLDIGQ